MRIGASGTTSVEGLQSPETLGGAGTFEAAMALTSACLDDLQLAIERVDFCRNVEDTSVGLVVAGNLSHQSPVVGATGQLHGLQVGRRLSRDGVDKPHGEWLGRGVTNVRGGGEQVVLEDGISLLSEGAESERDRAVAQFDVARLAHDVVGVGDDKVWETAVVLLKPLGALCVRLA